MGGGIGLPAEVMTATAGQIEFHQSLSGTSLLEIFETTNFVTTISVSALLKYTKISAYDNVNMNTLLWTAHLFGGGIGTAAIQANRSVIEFNQ